MNLTINIFKQFIYNLFKELSWTQLIRFFDYALLLYIIFHSIMGLVGICAYLVFCLSLSPIQFGFDDSVLHMNNRGTPDNYGFINPISNNTPCGPGGNPGTPGGGFPPGFPGTHHHQTQTQIIHDDGSWSNGIRNLFIYGTGGARFIMSAKRGGSPTKQLFIIGSTILAETSSKLVINALNDPTYLRAHISNIKAIFHGTDSASVFIDSNAMVAATGDSSFSTFSGSGSAVNVGPVSNLDSIPGSSSYSGSLPGGTDEIAKSMMGLNIDFTKIYESFLSKIVNYLNYIFEPVQHTFTIDVMSNHIQNLSLLLFILTALILIFFISLLFNVTLFIFSDRLINYFTKKYILWYLKLNKKMIAFEIIILSLWIFYLLYVNLTVLKYLATHPVIYSNIGG